MEGSSRSSYKRKSTITSVVSLAACCHILEKNSWHYLFQSSRLEYERVFPDDLKLLKNIR